MENNFKVGQLVEHKYHAVKGIITKISSDDVKINITEGKNPYVPLNTMIIANENVVISEEPSQKDNHKLVIDFEVNGLEEALEQARELADLREDQSVFEVELGGGLKFKGTKSDYEFFISQLEVLNAIANKI